MDIQQIRSLNVGDTVRMDTVVKNTFPKTTTADDYIILEISPKTWKDDRVWDKSRNGQEYCWVVIQEKHYRKPQTFTVDSFRLY